MYVTDWETPYEAHGAFPLTSSAIVGADDFWRRKPPRCSNRFRGLPEAIWAEETLPNTLPTENKSLAVSS